MAEKETWLPKYIIVTEQREKNQFMPRVLAGGSTLESIRGTRRRSGWDNHNDISIYKRME